MTGGFSALNRLQKAQLVSRPTGGETRPANVCHRNQQTTSRAQAYSSNLDVERW
ncbi:hypothetical protein CCHR01_15047 [Colletotrichum chrysophilum]|uniref:Uncharacterized protein n=1 Tax=Colletotrichum chrysophilum TaxID=1836956 RepID=A0AAD9A6E2_9PEZI|nr:hypothetical protein CCHR01_15047 [Colletotrichum chrysophilum]